MNSCMVASHLMNNRVLFLIRTRGLKYDDRVRKESISLSKLGMHIKIGVIENSNKSKQGYTKYNIQFKSFSTISRNIFSAKKGLIFKIIDMYIHFILLIIREKPDVLWLHNVEMSGMILIAWVFKKLNLIKQIVWDQHELLPEWFFDNKRVIYIIKFLINSCNVVILANHERKDYVLAKIGNGFANKFYVLENYPDQSFISLPKGNVPSKMKNWLNNTPYILAQGGAEFNRYFPELVEAILKFKSVKLVVVGPVSGKMVKFINNSWGESVAKFIYFTDIVPQFEIATYIDCAVASIILYSKYALNEWLCAPNRLYQALCRNVPVVVGCNPPMKKIVHKYECGIVLDGDGENVDDIESGIKLMLDQSAIYRKKIKDQNIKMTWEYNNKTLKEIIKNITLN